MSENTGMNVEEHFRDQCEHHGNINEHLPALRRYAEQCRHVTELGVCSLGSTWAFLAAKPEWLISVDKAHPSTVGGNLDEAWNISREIGVNFQFQEKDDTQIEISPTDLLFIDTWHVYGQLKKELELHASKAGRFIILHDTETFGEKGEDGNSPGLNLALDEFLKTWEGRNWKVIEKLSNCNGLTVLERVSPRIKVFAFFYNEEFLIPFFLSHYWFADIHAIASKSTDRTMELLNAAKNVTVEEFEFPDGLINDDLKVQKLNECVTRPESYYDWFLVADADEFIWPSGNPHCTRARILPEDGNVIIGSMWQVYRNESEGDLDPSKSPVVLQRSHGMFQRDSGFNVHYKKPMLIRPNNGFRFMVGNHSLEPNPNILFSKVQWDGAHWSNADLSFCVQRRIRDRQNRLSKVNLEQGMGGHNLGLTEDSIRQLCSEHLKDPKLF